MFRILLLAAAAAAVAVAWRSPFHAFCVFLFTLPFESALAIKGAVTITPGYLAMVLVIGVAILRGSARGLKGSFKAPATGLVCLYIAVAVASLVMTMVAPPPATQATSELLRWRVAGMRSVTQIALFLFSSAAYFITVYFCSTPARVRTATRVFIVVVALTGLYGLFQMAGARYRVPLVGGYASAMFETPASLRPNATFQEAMNFGHFLLAGLPLLIALHLHRSRLRGVDRTAYGVAAFPMIFAMTTALFLTIGRSAWLGFALAMATVVLASQPAVRRRALMLALIVVVIAVPAAAISFGSLRAAFFTIGNRFDFRATGLMGEQRLWYFPFLLSLARHYPILGVGYGNYPLYQVFAFDLYGIAGAYGVFWQALVETGVPGFVALVALAGVSVGSLLRAGAAADDPSWRPYLVGWAGCIVGLFSAYFFFGDRFSLYVWVVLGLATSTVRASRMPAEFA